jgi:hypothetical protein
MTDDSTGDDPHVHPTKSNFLLIVIVLGVECSPKPDPCVMRV